MLGALTGGPKPLDGVEPGSAVIEAPILDGPRELGWMIFEVDAEYARRQWFPDLIAAHLNPGPDDPLSLRILGPERNGEPIYSVNPAPGPPDAVIPFFPQRFPDFAPGPRFGPGGRKGPPPGARKGPARPGRPGPPGRWLLEIRAGQRGVDATVNRVRNRNLALSLTLLGLIGVSGLLLIRATFRARRLAELQFQFLAGVSHELRTPLAIIRGAAHNLLTGIVPHEERRRAYLQAIATNSTQLGDMVEQLLAYAKARQEGKTELEPVEVSAAVSEALESLTYELEASGAQLDLDLPATLPLVWADPAGLRRALLNLIANAAKHGGRQIAISAREAAPFVEIRVADDGEGIPPEEAARIFEPFFRGERARSSKIRGTGLGLSLVQQIAAAAGGEVALESPPGQGAAFILRLRTEAPKR
jgi:signal transduction histidine kinase